MIIILCVIALFISIAITNQFLDDDGAAGILGIFGVIGMAIFGLALLIVCIFVIVNNSNTHGLIASNKQRYESLIYQLENNLYDNDNDLGKKELYNQIEEWNASLAEGKAMQNDFWFGVFYPDIYDHFEFIELDKGDIHVKK